MEVTSTAEDCTGQGLLANGGECTKHPRSGEDVVVAGMSCRLPESDSPVEFWQHLITNRDMVTEDGRRWPPGMNGLPRRYGKLKDLSRFDAEFFCVNPLQAHAMDPQLRILLEVVYEAMFDAGVTRSGGSRKRTNQEKPVRDNTGVFVGSMFSEALEAAGGSKGTRVGYGLTGAVGSMLANYVSFCFDFIGPSETIHTSCSASLCAFHSAVQSIRTGECNSAIVAGTNVLLSPSTAMHMLRLGMLSPEGACKTFDLDANGYVRAEGIIALYLTRRENALRSYLRVLSTGRACDGYKPEGITYPSSSAQKHLIESTCSSGPLQIDPAAIYYVEAHGTGTQAGDFEECKALDIAICAARRERCKDDRNHTFAPLLVGSVKSNIGHCEPASGLAGMVKVILSFLNGIIPPNLHFEFPNPKILSLIEMRLSVVTEPTPLPPDAIVGLNSFGFGGSIAHAVLQGEGQQPPVKAEKVSLAYPVSSRTPEGLRNLMDFVATHHSNKDLLHLLSRTCTACRGEDHMARGYVLWSKDGQIEKVTSTFEAMKRRPLWLIFGGMGTQWSGIGKDLLQYPTFAKTIDECYRAVPSSVKNLVTTGAPINFDLCTVVDEVTAVCATTLGLYNLLKEMGVSPDGLVGHSLGELAVCYADGCLTLEQCMQVAYWRVKCVIDADVPPGAMGAVGLTWEEAKRRCPKWVWPCCNNATKNVTVTGRKEEVEKFIEEVRQEGKFAKMVKSSGLAFHSPLMQPAVSQKTLEIMRKIIPKPKLQSPKWVVTSFSPDEQKEPILCSAEFHVTSLVKPVYFYEAIQKIPKDAVVIEVGPHSILQFILKSNLSQDQIVLPLQDFKQPDQSVVFMKTIGTCYNLGVDSINPLNILEPIEYPISPKTPNVSHLVAWDHTEEWFVPKPEDFTAKGELVLPPSLPLAPTKLDGLPAEVSFAEYKVGGCCMLSPAYQLLQVWKAVAQNRGKQHTDFPVHFSDVTFSICESSGESMSLSFLPDSGQFELFDDNALVLRGKVAELSVDARTALSQSPPTALHDSSEGTMLTKQDIYKELDLRGYQLSPAFQVLQSANIKATECYVGKMNAMTPLYSRLEALFQMAFLNCDRLSKPASMCSLTIDPDSLVSDSVLCYNDTTTEYGAAGVVMKGLKMEPMAKQSQPNRLLLNEYAFEGHLDFEGDDRSPETILQILIGTALENTYSHHPMVLHILNGDMLFVDEQMSLVRMVCKIVKSSCPVRDICHDIIVIGKPESRLSVELQKCPPANRGGVYWSDTLNSTPLKHRYDLIIMDYSWLDSKSKSCPDLLGQTTPNGFLIIATVRPGFVPEVPSEWKFRKMRYHWTEDHHCLELHRKGDLVIEESDMAFVHVQKSTSSWLAELQELLLQREESRKKRIYCISEFEASAPSGLIGMTNCLKLESYGDRLRCLYLFDTTWEVFRKTEEWKHTRECDLLINFIKDGDYEGSFRHIPLEGDELARGRDPLQILSAPSPSQPAQVVILTGGLGGFGLELAEWLVEKGARFLIFTTRSKVRSAYQARKIERWASKGVTVRVSNLDVSKESEAIELVQKPFGDLKVEVAAVFHLANVLSDALFESQTVESFDTVLNPKLVGAVNLDKATRIHTPKALFVMFSSVVAGFGHHGLSNYGFANSAMDMLCENRRVAGLHGLAIQWGPVEDVGILMESGKVKNVAGFAPKPISSYLESLDTILASKCAVVSCYLPGELKQEPLSKSDSIGLGTSCSDEKAEIKNSLCRILGFKRPEKLRADATMSQLGVDSLLCFEVQQLLAGEYGLTLSAKEIMSTTVGSLVKKTSPASAESAAAHKATGVGSSDSGISLVPSDTLLGKHTDE